MIVIGERFRNYFIFSFAYSLIMWLMRSSNNFEKNSHFESMTAKNSGDVMSHILK